MRKLAAFLFTCAMIQPASADTLVATKGPYTWTTSCGQQMEITVRVYKDVAAFPGLLKWDYEIHNTSVHSPTDGSVCGWGTSVDGISDFWMGFPQALPDLANLTAPTNWFAEPVTGGDGVSIIGIFVSSIYDVLDQLSGYGPTSPLTAGSAAVHVTFTTQPRSVAELAACPDDGSSIVCGSAGTAMITCPMSVRNPASPRTQRPARPDRRPSRMARSVRLAGGCDYGVTGQIAAPGPIARLESFSWTSTSSPAPYHFWRENADWRTDTLQDEGTTEITTPAWTDTTGDGVPEVSDPVAYKMGQTPVFLNVALVTDGPITGSARIRITSDNETLEFPDTDVQFTYQSGQLRAAMLYHQSQKALPSSVANIDTTLTWSVSFDSGATFTEFTKTTHKVFVVLDAPNGFPGNVNWDLPERPHITAKRLDSVTQSFSGKTTAREVIDEARSAAWGADVRRSIGGADSEPYHGNPWAVLDSPPSPLALDCFSLTAIALAQVSQVGVDSSMALAFATRDGDASEWDTRTIAGTQVWLDFYGDSAGQDANPFEAFLILEEGGGPVEAHTLAPKNGPFLPTEVGALTDLPSETWKRLAFTVIYWTLTDMLGDPPSFAGQQWWVDGARTRIQGPVALPVPNPLPANPSGNE